MTSRRDDSGLVALEWLVILGAVAGLAAFSALAVQRIVEDTVEAPEDPLVRVLDADIAAAFVASEAQEWFDAAHADPADLADPPPPYDDDVFRRRCEQLGELQQFGDLITPAWSRPGLGADRTPGTADDLPARCTVTPLTR